MASATPDTAPRIDAERREATRYLILPALLATSSAVLVDGLQHSWAYWGLGGMVAISALSQRDMRRPFHVLVCLLPFHMLSGVTPWMYMAAPRLELALHCFFLVWFIREIRGKSLSSGSLLGEMPWMPFLAYVLGSALVVCSMEFWSAEGAAFSGLAATLFQEPPFAPFFTVRAFFTFLESFLLYVFIRTRLERQELVALGRVLMTAAWVTSLAGVLLYWVMDRSSYFHGVNRAGALFQGPNEFGTYLLMLLPLEAWWASQARRGWPRLLALLLLGVGGVLLYLTRSQGAWVAAAVQSLLVMLLLVPPSSRYHRAVIPVCLTLALAGLGWVGFQLMTKSPAQLNALSDGRYYLFLSGLNMFRESPWVGVGLGKFQQYLCGFYPAGIDWRARYEHAHNMYLQILAELGLCGLALFLWPFARLLRRAVRQARSNPLVLALLSSLVGALVHSLTDYTLLIVPISLTFWVLVGMLEVALRSDAEGHGGSAHPVRAVMTIPTTGIQ